MSIKNFFNIDLSSARDYFITLSLTIIIAYLSIVVFRFLLHQFFKRTHIIEEKKEETIESVVKNTSNYVLAVIIFIAAIKPFLGDLKEVIFAGGIIAAVIGFGAQKLINDIISGIFMIFEGTIKRGDFINVNGEPEGGTVEELGFRIVKIRLINGKLVTIQNGEIRKMVNGSVEKRRVFESVVVSFSENPSRIRALLQEVCDELNILQKEYLKTDKLTGEFVEEYRVYGLHSLDVSPTGYKFSIVSTVIDTEYMEAAQGAKEVLSQKLFDNKVKMGEQYLHINKK